MGQLLLAILFLYLTGFQLLPLWNHHQNKLWVDLYPVAEKNKEAAFFFLMVIVLSLQAVIFTALMLIKGQWTAGVISLLAGVGFIYYFVFIYSKKRVKG
ncbi:ABC transporter permease [Neobacillus sp. PS3-34]|nr:ABC transporter permease [Neobacillus sp. PS3-34]WML49646.1 ABC transporter permease [Neobacillus sp. PS3-34]